MIYLMNEKLLKILVVDIIIICSVDVMSCLIKIDRFDYNSSFLILFCSYENIYRIYKVILMFMGHVGKFRLDMSRLNDDHFQV